MHGSVRFRLFGEVAMEAAGERPALGGRRDRRLLVALLAAEGRAVPRHLLMEWIWDEVPNGAAEDLHRLMTRLRKRLAMAGLDQILISGNGLCRLDVPPDSVDLHRFRAAVSKARYLDDAPATALLEEALDLFRGTPFAGLDGRRIDGFRHTLEEERAGAELSYLRRELRLERHREHVADVVRLLAERPGDSAVVDVSMRILYLSGRETEALSAFDDHSRRCRKRGIDPPPELVELHRAMLRREDIREHAAAPRPSTSERTDRPVPVEDLAAARDAGEPPPGAMDLLTGGHLLVVTGDMAKARTTALHLLADLARRDGLTVLETTPSWDRPSVEHLPPPGDGRGHLLALRRPGTDRADPHFAEDLLGHAARLALHGSFLVVAAVPELWRDCWQVAGDVTVRLPELVPESSVPLDQVQLRLTGPDGHKSAFPLGRHKTSGARLGFGRAVPGEEPPDVVLDTGSSSPVGRRHAWLEHRDGRWWFAPASKNPPRIRRRGAAGTERVANDVPLRDGDVLVVPLLAGESGKSRSWEIEFLDPRETTTHQGDDT